MNLPGPSATREEIAAFLSAKSAPPPLPFHPPVPACLYVPPDAEEAHKAFGANCGPTALAALLGRPVMAVRPAFPWFPQTPWCSPNQLVEAVHAAMPGALVHRVYPRVHAPEDSFAACLPSAFQSHGLATIQIDGPWCQLSDVRVAYRYTHTVASRMLGGELWIYDINAGPSERPGAWAPFVWWAEHVMAALVRDEKRATGWLVKVAFEVRG